jgi:hypothetical protein
MTLNDNNNDPMRQAASKRLWKAALAATGAAVSHALARSLNHNLKLSAKQRRKFAAERCCRKMSSQPENSPRAAVCAAFYQLGVIPYSCTCSEAREQTKVCLRSCRRLYVHKKLIRSGAASHFGCETTNETADFINTKVWVSGCIICSTLSALQGTWTRKSRAPHN